MRLIKNIFALLAVLMATASCSKDDNPTPEPVVDPVVTPAEAVVGDWFAQVEAGGSIDYVPYDSFAVYLKFQSDGHGLFMQYFLYQGIVVNSMGRETDYTIDADGNITVNIKGTQVQLGQDMRLADDRLTFDIPSHNQYGLTLLKATEQQMQMVGEWGINIDQPDEGGGDDDDGDTMTEVTGDGATGPARARQRGGIEWDE